MLDYIRIKYAGYLLQVTGDATGRNSTALVQDDMNYYTVIMEKLNLSPNQLLVPSINPRVDENRVLVNAAFALADVKMDPVNCQGLIFDCQFVSVNDAGKIEKGDRSNPRKRADHLDNFRYYLNTFHKNLLTL